MKSLIIILLLSLSVYAWCQPNAFKPEKRALMSYGTFTGHVEFTWLCSREGPQNITEVVSVDKSEVDTLENNFLNIYKMPRTDIYFGYYETDSLERYAFQYFGLILGKHKYIYINAFPKALFERTESFDPYLNPMAVCDGGELYWGVLFDPETRQFSGLYYNNGPPPLAPE